MPKILASWGSGVSRLRIAWCETHVPVVKNLGTRKIGSIMSWSLAQIWRPSRVRLHMEAVNKFKLLDLYMNQVKMSNGRNYKR